MIHNLNIVSTRLLTRECLIIPPGFVIRLHDLPSKVQGMEAFGQYQWPPTKSEFQVSQHLRHDL